MGGVISILHDAVGINNENAVLNGVKDGFLEFALAGEALHENTEVDRVEVFETAQDFIKPGIFHMLALAKVLELRMTILEAGCSGAELGKAFNDLGGEGGFKGGAEGFAAVIGVE